MPSEEERNAVVADILDGAFPTRRFYVLLILSTTIAAFGLIANSAAVIIGAMIVAPLMGPILGLALGMVTADHNGERRSLLAEATGAGIAILIGYLVGLVPLNPGIGSEILARTAPTSFDLGIAFASGLAAGYASVNRKISSALAGVAISVALVPPLASCGLLLAMGEGSLSFGAFLLFIANFFCIQTAAALVFWFFRLEKPSTLSGSELWRYRLRFLPGVIAVAAMAWFMTGTLANLIAGHQFQRNLTRILNEEIAQRTGGQLDEIIRHGPSSEGYDVVASALTPTVFDAPQVRQIEVALRRVRHDIHLTLRSVVSQDIDRSGRVYLNRIEQDQAEASIRAREFLDEARSSLVRFLKEVDGAALDSLERTGQEGTPVLVAVVRTPEPITAAYVADFETRLSSSLEPVKLIVRSVITQVYDSTGELYVPIPEGPSQPDPRTLRRHQKITDVLTRRLAAVPARRLASIAFDSEGAVHRVHVTAEATQAVRPEEVAQIEADLKKFVDPDIELTVRTELAATAQSQGWLTPD